MASTTLQHREKHAPDGTIRLLVHTAKATKAKCLLAKRGEISPWAGQDCQRHVGILEVAKHISKVAELVEGASEITVVAVAGGEVKNIMQACISDTVTVQVVLQ